MCPGQPVTQLLLLVFLILLIFVSPLTSLCWSSHVFDVFEAPSLSPSLQVHSPALNFLVCLSLFSCFTDLGFLSLPCSASSVQTVAKAPNI